MKYEFSEMRMLMFKHKINCSKYVRMYFYIVIRYYKNDQYRINVIYMYRMDGFTRLNKFFYEMKSVQPHYFYHQRTDSLNIKNDEQRSMGKILYYLMILKNLHNTIC